MQALADRVVYSEDITESPCMWRAMGLGTGVLLDYGDVVVHVFREEERVSTAWSGCGAMRLRSTSNRRGARAVPLPVQAQIFQTKMPMAPDAGSSDEDPDKD